jgi:hypothetical protein
MLSLRPPLWLPGLLQNLITRSWHPQVLQLAQVCASAWGHLQPAGKGQLSLVHHWLRSIGMPQGLLGMISSEQLQQCVACFQASLVK